MFDHHLITIDMAEQLKKIGNDPVEQIRRVFGDNSKIIFISSP